MMAYRAMLRRASIAAVWSPIVIGSASAEPPEAAAVLERAADACEEVKTATYTARYERRATPEAEPLVREGVVSFSKWAKGDLSEREPAGPGRMMKIRPAFPSELNASIRMELTEGVIYTFDRRELRLLIPQQSKMIVAPIEVGGERFITGNVIGSLVETALLKPDRLRRLAEPPGSPDDPDGLHTVAPTLTYEGIEEVAGVKCHVVARSHPGSELYSDIHDRWSIGVNDGLLRQSETSGIYNGERQKTSLLIKDLRINEKIDEAMFAQTPGAGIEVDHFQPPKPPEMLAVGDEAPAWTLRDAQGAEHSLADYRGRIVLLDFWGTWCGPCLMAMPSLQSLHEKFSERGVKVIGISCREPAHADPAKTMKDRGFTYGLLLNGDRVAQAYHVSGYPTFYAIDGEGRIIHRHSGYGKGMEEMLGSMIEAHLVDAQSSGDEH